MRKFRKLSFEDICMDTFILAVMVVLVIATLYPFINVIALSLNKAVDSIRGGITLWPRQFTIYNYVNILQDAQIYSATLISILRTVLGTLLSLIASISLAFILSKRDFVFRKPLTVFLIFTMYFSGGIIPTYFLFRSLGLINKFTVYVVPGLLSAWNVIVIRSYMDGLPASLEESAKIDGAKEFTVLFRIILPLIMPVAATIALFCAVGQWNSWFDTYIYASGNDKLSTLQYELMKKLASAAQNMSGNAMYNPEATQADYSVTPSSVRATMTVIATLPILIVYPFLQKYFITGLTLGGVKE
jgi:putative aldouronate transport system permease protein